MTGEVLPADDWGMKAESGASVFDMYDGAPTFCHELDGVRLIFEYQTVKGGIFRATNREQFEVATQGMFPRHSALNQNITEVSG